jgi:deoxycytidylate deaminase
MLNTLNADGKNRDKTATGSLLFDSAMIRRLNKCVELSMSLIEDIDSDSKHVSFVLRRSKIIALGVNRSMQTHPLALKLNCRFGTMHSELSAILKAKKSNEFYNATLVNVRLSSSSLTERTPILRNSKPCKSCQRLILACPEIKKVIYSTDNGWYEYA